MELKGKRVLVTGGAIRAGAYLCRALAQQGAEVIIHCRSSRAEAEALAACLPGTGHSVLTADFSQPGEAEKMFEAALPVDILINNASVYRLPGSDEETSPVYKAVNLDAPAALIGAYLQQELPAGGVVINILDQQVLTPVGADEPPYLVSRRALAELTKEYALRYAAGNIRFNAVAPGPMIPPKGLEGSKMVKTLKTVPLNRRVEPEDFAAAVCFLIGNDSITGAILPVDCGQHLFPQD